LVLLPSNLQAYSQAVQLWVTAFPWADWQPKKVFYPLIGYPRRFGWASADIFGPVNIFSTAGLVLSSLKPLVSANMKLALPQRSIALLLYLPPD
jgi:hypothetical protein